MSPKPLGRGRSPAKPLRPSRPAAPAPSGSGGVQRLLGLLGAFGPPITVITALLVYFGWARSYVQARALGLDDSVLGMSSQEYILRSVDTLYPPLIGAAVIGLAWLFAHERVVSLIDDKSHLPVMRHAFRWLRWTVVVCFVLGSSYLLLVPSWGELIAPMVFLLGLLIATYAMVMLRRIDVTEGTRTASESLASWHWAMSKLLVGIIVAALLFWEVSEFAGMVGTGLARQVIAGLKTRTGVIVYSPKDLRIEGPGIEVQRFTGKDSAYEFRYSGLRLLQQSGGKYFLLPVDWQWNDAKVIVLRDDNSIRLEFTRQTG